MFCRSAKGIALSLCLNFFAFPVLIICAITDVGPRLFPKAENALYFRFTISTTSRLTNFKVRSFATLSSLTIFSSCPLNSDYCVAVFAACFVSSQVIRKGLRKDDCSPSLLRGDVKRTDYFLKKLKKKISFPIFKGLFVLQRCNERLSDFRSISATSCDIFQVLQLRS